MSLKVLVTGASNGIGRELALQLSEKGHQVIAIARNEERLTSLNEESESEMIVVPFDVTSFQDYDELKKNIESRIDRLDVIINNAGALVNKPFNEMTMEEFDRVSNTNYKAPYFLTQSLMTLMENSREKTIINIGSVGGVGNTDKFSGLSAYSSSKGAISILTECLAKELGSKGFTINCLALGAVDTEMLNEAFPGYKPEMTPEKMAKYIISFILESKGIISGKVIQLAGIQV